MKPSATLFLALATPLLSACTAVQKPEPEIKRAQPKPKRPSVTQTPPMLKRQHVASH
jgi:hypothetical protein